MATHLGTRLLAARREAGVSRADLARAAGLHPVHIRKIELGERPNLSLATASSLAHALGADLEWLANGEGSAPTAEHVCATVKAACAKAAA